LAAKHSAKKAWKKLRERFARANLMAGIVPLTACGVKKKGYKILW
jgi:hypothetical protein